MQLTDQTMTISAYKEVRRVVNVYNLLFVGFMRDFIFIDLY